MDIERALEILEPLTDGIDPLSGEFFPVNSPYQQPEIVRALYIARASLVEARERLCRQRMLPAKAGKPWEMDDDVVLTQGYENGRPLHLLAAELERTRSAIQARLFKLGLVEEADTRFRV